MQFNILIED